jgi:retron-type reverse transcriptase
MPRITIEYGDDEQAEAREAMEASRMACALREIDNQCRLWLKHNADVTDTERERLKYLREAVPEFVRDC